jgi:predicted AlkP superfamily phosphohydrolase/phosphomutase
LAVDGCAPGWRQSNANGTRVIVLGIDGMDPVFLERHWAELPNLDRLRREGDFKRLATTMPPQSPVAWSTFITGESPDGHGIYDFVHRDPETRMPLSSIAVTRPGRKLGIGPYRLPLTGDRIEAQRRGTPFWKLLAEQGIPATILRMPTDFPPEECEVHSLAGMGTPDLRGTFGTFAFFTDREEWANRRVTGGEIFPVRVENHRTTLRLPGPVNPLRREQPETHLNIDVFVDPVEPVARFDVGERRVILKQGELSEWIPIRFPLLPALADAAGMVRIWVKEIRPHLAVYVSPVNIDPRAPAMPISEPKSYSGDLARQLGAYYTQGMPYDTAALRHGVFTRDEYRAHSREVSRQTIGLLRTGIQQFRDGVLFFHFFGIDQDAHMLWGSYDSELLETYKLVDETLGWVREKARDAILMVVSDHGFARFDRAVHLNTWLRQEGYLWLTDPTSTGEGEFFANVDWSRTRAYAVGLNSIYVNQQSRERDGIVAAGEESRRLLGEIEARLVGFRDPANGKAVVLSVATPRRQDKVDRAPDLIVGYAPGYRASWQTALGATPAALIEDNADEWRGDHCIDPKSVPGVMLANRKTSVADPRLEDVTVTILEAFGVQKENRMTGRNLYPRQ